MATKEILIGREVPAGNYTVPGNFGVVSRRHAKLIVNDGEYVIVDTDSANGTYVGGVSVKSKVVKVNDIIELGTPNGYKVIVGDILGLQTGSKPEPPKPPFPPGYDPKNPAGGFDRQVMDLGRRYYQIKREIAELQGKMQSEGMIKRMGPGMLLGVVTSILGATVEDDMKVPMLVIGGVLTLIVFIVANKWAASSAINIRKRIEDLTVELDKIYECPGCHASWKAHTFDWYAGKTCPACKKKINVTDYQLMQLKGS